MMKREILAEDRRPKSLLSPDIEPSFRDMHGVAMEKLTSRPNDILCLRPRD